MERKTFQASRLTFGLPATSYNLSKFPSLCKISQNSEKLTYFSKEFINLGPALPSHGFIDCCLVQSSFLDLELAYEAVRVPTRHCS